MKKKQILLVLATLFYSGIAFAQTQPQPKDPNADLPFRPNPQTNQKALQHFGNMKFGVYMNWGPYTLTGQEASWSMTNLKKYESNYSKWIPKGWNPNEWGNLIKTVGAKYFVWVAKHHDGFCLWNTKTTDNSVMHYPYHTDVTAEVVKMCKKYNIDLGLYLSIIDAHFSKWNQIYPHGAKMPGFPREIPQIASLTERQGLELIHEFHPFELWFDGGWLDGWRSSQYPKELEEAFRKAEPDILMTRLGNYVDDYPSMEAKIGTYRPYPWEMVSSVAYPRYSWGNDLKYKSVPFLVETLCRIVCGNGNYLLAFVPDANGKIPVVQEKIASELGSWVHQSSEAIFDTKGGPYYPNIWGGSTRKGNKVYLYILSEAPDTFHLPSLGEKIKSERVITGGKIIIKQNKKGLTVMAPAKEKDVEGVAIVELTLSHPVSEMIEASNPKSPIYEKVNKEVAPIQDRNGKVLN